MILLFLGSWRSTLIIAVSIPLSILTSVIVLSLLRRDHQHHDAGRARARRRHPGGRRHRRRSRTSSATSKRATTLREAILEGAAQIAVPALVSTLCICIVFLPMFFLSGVARYLFVPLAEAVVFAMLASYVLSRTLVPTLAMYLLQPKRARSGAPLAQPARARPAGVRARLRAAAALATSDCSPRLVAPARVFVPVFLAVLPLRLAAAAVARRRTSSRHRQRAVHPAPARQDRHPHRGDRAAGRPGRGRRSGARSRRPSSTTSSTTSGCRTAPSTTCTALRPHRRRRRRHPGLAEGGASAHRGLRPRRCGASSRGSFPA